MDIFFYVQYVVAIVRILSLFIFISGTSDVLLKRPDYNDLLEQLADIDSHWNKIGLALRVPVNKLNGLNGEQTENLSEVIRIWMDSGNQDDITWQTVILAIEGTLVNNRRKANKIRKHLGLPI